MYGKNKTTLLLFAVTTVYLMNGAGNYVGGAKDFVNRKEANVVYNKHGRFPVMPECSYEKLPSGKFVAVNVSLQAPGMHTGSYESFTVIWPNNRVTRDVIVYWENYLKCKDVVQFHYKAFYMYRTKNGEYMKQYTDYVYANHAVFAELRYDRAYDIVVIAINKNEASDISTIRVPSEKDKTKPKKPSWLKKTQVSHTVYELSWEGLGEHKPMEFLRSNKYMLYWCENELNSLLQCNGKIHTVSVPLSESNRTITVPNPYKNYQFGISAEKFTGGRVKSYVGSGLMWEMCPSALPNTRPDVIIIKKVWPTIIAQTYIGLRWKIDCESMIEFFSAYHIYYCPVISPENRRCKERLALKFQGRYPRNNTLPLAIIQDLKPSTMYMFSVDILTHADNNLGVMFRTAPLILTTST